MEATQHRRRKRRPPIRVPADERIVYSVVEAGLLLGMGRNASYAAAKSREIPTIQIGGRLIVPKLQFHKRFEAEATDGEK